MKPVLLIYVMTFLLNNGTVEAADKPMEERVLKPLIVISGADSHITDPSCERISSQDDWSKVWIKHLGPIKDGYGTSLEVDFDRCSLVTIFRGREQNTRGIEVNVVEETPTSLVIRFTPLKYQTSGPSENKFDCPYAFIVLPKTNKAIVLEENVQNYKDEKPEWKVYARLKEK